MPNHAPFIYIIGPLHAKSAEGVKANIECAEQVAFNIQCAAHNMNIPIITFCPHSETGWLLTDAREGRRVHAVACDDLYMRGYLSLLMSGKVDAVYFIGSSPGADVELMIAENMGIRVLRSASNVESFLLEWRDS